jgi:hypothetical protein
MRQAPSSTEYSEWTWRWAKLTGILRIRPGSDDSATPARGAR